MTKMDKIIATLVMVFFAVSVAHAAVTNWVVANQKTLQWDPVTTLEDGTSIPSDSVIKYEVFTAQASPTGDMIPNTTVSRGITTGTSMTISLTQEGRYLAGLQAIREIAGAEVGRSTLVWSDNADYTYNAQTFGLVFYASPRAPGGMRAP